MCGAARRTHFRASRSLRRRCRCWRARGCREAHIGFCAASCGSMCGDIDAAVYEVDSELFEAQHEVASHDNAEVGDVAVGLRVIACYIHDDERHVGEREVA